MGKLIEKIIAKIILIMFVITVLWIFFKVFCKIDIIEFFIKPMIIETWKQIKNIF